MTLWSPVRVFQVALAAALGDSFKVSFDEKRRSTQDLPSKSVDVALVDVAALGGLETLYGLSVAPSDARVLALGIPADGEFAIACARSGAIGLVSVDASLPELIEAIRSVARGQRFCCPKVAASLAEYLAAGASKAPIISSHLTAREHAIANLVVLGRTNKEIASELFISVSTVKTHLHHLLSKYNVRDRHELAAVHSPFATVTSQSAA